MLHESSKFFSEEYLSICMQQNHDEANFHELEELNSGKPCDIDLFESEYEKNHCEQNLEGVINRGLISSMQNLFNTIEHNKFNEYTKEQALDYINSQYYSESSENIHIILKLLKEVVYIFK